MYRTPFVYDPAEPGQEYGPEPTDAQANVLARALAHWISAYLPDEKDRTAQSIVLDILESNPGSAEPLTRDEAVTIAKAVGVEV